MALHYKIHLEPDLEQFRFRGETIIKIEDMNLVEEGRVMLDARDLVVEDCHVNGTAAAFSLNSEAQKVTIELPVGLAGPFRIRLDYHGRINDQYAGLYRSRYHQDGEEKWMASTQFQANDARRVFPCFDTPALKATFDIQLTIAGHLSAVGNTAVASETPVAENKKRVQFEPSPPMSTYLVFIGVGQFETIAASQNEYTVQVITTPGKKEYGRFALKIGQESLQFCEDYTGLPYPLSKCDLIAVPDSIGAMENYGAIRHSETMLLVYPEKTPQSLTVLIGQIIAHEVSHMWFGNLVTPVDWKYLWLNESFATYFTFVIPEARFPHWHIWQDFALDRMRSGLERDGLLETLPIELPAGQALAGDPSPTPANAPLVYNKGAAVLRMLAAYCGEESFKQGIHNYLQTYQFKSVTSPQFWDAFAAGAQKDVSSFAAHWIHQAGYPLLTAARSGAELHIHQQQFTYLPSPSESLWSIPIDLLTIDTGGNVKTSQFILDEQVKKIELPPDTAVAKLNHKFTGFYRVQYDKTMLISLGQFIWSGKLDPLDSFNLENDLFALVKQGTYPVQDYLTFLESYFIEEIRYLPLINILQNLLELQLLLPDHQSKIRQLGRLISENALARIGWEGWDKENHQAVRRQQMLLWAAGSFGSEPVRHYGESQFATWQDGTAVPHDILPAILRLGALFSPQALATFRQRLKDKNLAEAETLFILEAMAQLPEKQSLLAALEFNWHYSTKSQRPHLIQAAAHNPAAISILWDWITQQQDDLETLHPGQVARLLVRVIPTCGLGQEAAVTEFCQKLIDKEPLLQETLQLGLEWLAINGRLREKDQ